MIKNDITPTILTNTIIILRYLRVLSLLVEQYSEVN